MSNTDVRVNAIQDGISLGIEISYDGPVATAVTFPEKYRGLLAEFHMTPGTYEFPDEFKTSMSDTHTMPLAKRQRIRESEEETTPFLQLQLIEPLQSPPS